MPISEKAQSSRPIRESRIIRPRPIGSVSEKKRERLQSHRAEYPVIGFVWRFVTIARGLLIITAVTALSTTMNYVRVGYLRTKEVILIESGKTITIADEYIGYLMGAAIVFALCITAAIVMRIDYHLQHLQEQCVERGVACEAVLGIDNGIFTRAETHVFYLQTPFHLARIVLMIVWFGWAYFIFSISR